MSNEKYTQKALEAIRDAQSMAQENSNQYIHAGTSSCRPAGAGGQSDRLDLRPDGRGLRGLRTECRESDELYASRRLRGHLCPAAAEGHDDL